MAKSNINNEKVFNEVDQSSQASSSQNLINQIKFVSEKLNYSKNDLQKIMLLGHGKFGDVFLAKICEADQTLMVKVI